MINFPHRPCERCDHVAPLVSLAGLWVCTRCAERIDRAAQRARDERLIQSGKKA